MVFSMIVPLNLSRKKVRRLCLKGKAPQRGSHVEEIRFHSSLPPITFVPPPSVPRSRETSLSSCGLVATGSHSKIVSAFHKNAGYDDAVSLLVDAQQSKQDHLIFDLCIKAISDSDKRLHDKGMSLAAIVYPHCDTSKRKRFIRTIEKWLPVCGYRPLPILLGLVETILRGQPEDFEWMFIELVIAFCVYIKSPEITCFLRRILTRITESRNIVLYISNREDAHFTDHLQGMDRRFVFVLLDPGMALYMSPQGYPVPLENVLLLFDSATFIWWRKPERLPDGTSPLDKFTKQDIREFVEQLRIKYVESYSLKRIGETGNSSTLIFLPSICKR